MLDAACWIFDAGCWMLDPEILFSEANSQAGQIETLALDRLGGGL
jgi:hypothetical protein